MSCFRRKPFTLSAVSQHSPRPGASSNFGSLSAHFRLLKRHHRLDHCFIFQGQFLHFLSIYRNRTVESNLSNPVTVRLPSAPQRYNTLDLPEESRVPTGMLLIPIGNPEPKKLRYAPLDTSLCSCRSYPTHLGLPDFSYPNMKQTHSFNSLST